MLSLENYFIFCSTVFIVWIFRALHLLTTLRKTARLTPSDSYNPEGFVSVLIPAKNEEKNIRTCIESLKAQDYKALEIIVINDNSSDQTEPILKSMGQFYVSCPPCPEGWTGKTHAIHCGVSHAKGEWLLFTDADTRHQPHGLRTALTHAQKNNLQFLTLLPFCLTGSFLEKLIQPMAMAFLGLWFSMEKVNDPKSPLYFANGQFLMMHRSLYEKVGGHKAVAKEFLEDFGLMQLSKKAGANAACAFGDAVYGTRMYDSFDSIWRGWRRIYQHAFQSKPLTLLTRTLNVFLFSVLPFIIFGIYFLGNFRHPWLDLFSLATLGLIFIICGQAYAAVRANQAYALLQPFTGMVLSLILLDAAGMAFGKKKTLWR
jgi:chlorobactene glucosyltransferase